MSTKASKSIHPPQESGEAAVVQCVRALATLHHLSSAPDQPVWVVLGQPLPVAGSRRGSLESLGSRGSAYTQCAGQSLEREAKREQGCSSQLLQQPSEAGQSKSRRKQYKLMHRSMVFSTQEPQGGLHCSGPNSCFIITENDLGWE